MGERRFTGVTLAIVGAALLALGLTAPQASAAPSCVPSGTNIVCSFTTPGADTFTVPGTGIPPLTIDAYGAQGGNLSSGGGIPGGLGGHSTVLLSLPGGAVLTVNVGGVGGNNNSALPNGGVNGGGSGGSGGSSTGPGGGGASDVRWPGTGLGDRLVVGGGGGGAGNSSGGAGGGTNGGTNGSNVVNGQGATQSAGGAAGGLGGGGTAGSSGSGGSGGSSSGSGGAGGGGGYFGGGGGGGFTGGFIGAGGGGSGFGTTTTAGVRSGDGLVTITYPGGQLRVIKDLLPAGAPGKFNLQIDGATEATDVGDGGNTGLKTVDIGTHTVGETAGTGTSLGDYSKSIECRSNDGAGVPVASGTGSTLSVNVAMGEQIACTITNTLTSLAPVTLTTTASAGVELGGSVHDAATLADGYSPAGQLTFRLYGPDDASCSGAPVFTDSVAVSGNGSYESANFTPTAAGTYRWVASYPGDPLNQPAAGSCNDPGESVTVSEPPPVTPAIEVSGVELDRKGGTAALTVESTVAGELSVDRTKKVKASGPVQVSAGGSAVLEAAPRRKAVRALQRDGRVTINPRVALELTDGSRIKARRKLTLRLG